MTWNWVLVWIFVRVELTDRSTEILISEAGFNYL